MNTTGTARAICATCFWRPMRCCSAEKGSGRSSRNASTSPSSTVPSGRCVAAAAISGKRWVMSSSPRDQRWTAPRALHQLRADAVPLPLEHPVRRLAERRRLLFERRRQEERIGPRPIDVGGLVRRAATRTTRPSASSRPSAAPRRSRPEAPAACASARTTSVCDTPTRSSPVSIFSSTNRCSRSSGAHHSVTRAPLRVRVHAAQRQDALLDPRARAAAATVFSTAGS